MVRYWILASFVSALAVCGKSDAYSQQKYVTPTQDTHYIIGFTADRSEVELEDRSIWRVRETFFSPVENWHKGDPVIIMPSKWSYLYKEFPYRIYNARTRNEIETIMSICPDRSSEFTKVVNQFNPYRNEITLTNLRGYRYTFKVQLEDYYIMSDWQYDDRIFVAKNEDRWSFGTSHKLLLINAETATQVRANE